MWIAAVLATKSLQKPSWMWVRELVRAYNPFVVTEGNDVDADTCGQIEFPIIYRYTSDDVTSIQMPMGPNVRVLNPCVGILFGEFDEAFGILDEDAGMWLESLAQDLMLIDD